jgi:hypothetical protein
MLAPSPSLIWFPVDSLNPIADGTENVDWKKLTLSVTGSPPSPKCKFTLDRRLGWPSGAGTNSVFFKGSSSGRAFPPFQLPVGNADRYASAFPWAFRGRISHTTELPKFIVHSDLLSGAQRPMFLILAGQGTPASAIQLIQIGTTAPSIVACQPRRRRTA